MRATRAKGKFRDRDDLEVAVLDALVDRGEEGMTVFELRSRVEADIDALEEALAALKADDLIAVEDGDRAVIIPADRVVPDGPTADPEPRSLIDEIRDRLPF